jgi:hypothetical protein
MTADPPARPAPAIGDLVDVVVELAGRLDVLADQVADLEHVVWRLERERRNRERENR